MHLKDPVSSSHSVSSVEHSESVPQSEKGTVSFQDFEFAEPILRSVLMEGYTTPTPIQAQSIRPILEGRDVVGCAQTGTGKTAAFALPLLHRLVSKGNPSRGSGRKIRVLVLASTRELASQIRDSFYTYGQYTSLRTSAIYGGVSQMPQEKALRNGIDILVATPGRLMDLMQQGFVDLSHVECLVLDEADRMLDMGFLPAIRQIVPHLPKNRQTLLFSATMPDAIIELASDVVSNPVNVKIEPVRKTTELVDQHLCLVPQKMKTSFLIEMIQELKPGRAIVFSKTKHGADRIAKHLFAANIKAEAIHSNKSQNKRQRILDDFKWRNPPVLIATDIAARGIDVDGVTHVFNFDMPGDAETYVHRIGRTGRAGASGMAISFCDPGERKLLRAVEGLLKRRLPLLRSVEAPREEQANTSHATGRGRERNSFERSRPVSSERSERSERRPRTEASREEQANTPHATGRGQERNSSERSRPASSERSERRPRTEDRRHREAPSTPERVEREERPARVRPSMDSDRGQGQRAPATGPSSFARKLAPKAKRPGKRERAEQRSQLATRIVEGEAIPQGAKKVRSKSTATKVAGAAKVGYAKNGPWSSRAPKKKFRKKG